MLRMVRNLPMETYVNGHHHAPLYDVELIDRDGFPEIVVAFGVDAEGARKVMAELGLGDA